MDNSALQFFINLSSVQSKVVRAFDVGLGNGIGFNDFVILYHLYHAPEQKMRRIDLADLVSLSPSGVTRMLAPMEKIGLIAKEKNKFDARVSFVKLAPGGKRLLVEALDRAVTIAEKYLPLSDISTLKNMSEIFSIFATEPPRYS